MKKLLPFVAALATAALFGAGCFNTTVTPPADQPSILPVVVPNPTPAPAPSPTPVPPKY